jgi:hypothetical protein
MDIPLEKAPFLEFENHKMYVLSPGPFGCEFTKLDVEEEMRKNEN